MYFNENTTSIIGNGVALNIPVLFHELQSIVEQGVPMPDIKISDRAQIVMSYHIKFDEYEEERLAGKSFGSTKSGIAPFYSDKFAKSVFRSASFLKRKKLLWRKQKISVRKKCGFRVFNITNLF